MDKVVHFEIPCEDMKRAETFYHQIFGWKTNFMSRYLIVSWASKPQECYTFLMALKVHRTLMSPKCKRKDFLIPEMKYCIIHTIETDEKMMPVEKGAINGGLMNRGEIKQPVITISVESIDATLSKLNHHGGKVIKDKMSIGDMGFVAYFQDCEGNVLGLWENKVK